MPHRYLLPLLMGVMLHAQSTPAETTIESLIDATLQNHPGIQASRQLVKSAEAGVEGAKWNYFPTPTVEFSQRTNRNGTTLRLEQPLWTGGKLDAAYDAATLQKEESELQLDENAYTLIDALLQSVQTFHHASGSIRALQEGKEELYKLRSMLERRIDAGVSSQADRELLLSRLSSITADLDTAHTRREMARRQIELLTSEHIDSTPLFDPARLSAPSADFKHLAEAIRSSHPTLKRLAVRTRLAEVERDRAKAVLWPNVSVRAERVSGSVYSDEGSTESLIYLNAQFSPGAGFSSFSSIQSAEAKILQAQFDQQSKERELIDAAVRDLAGYRTANERLEAMHQTIGAAQNVFDSYARLFIAGKRQWLDLVNALRELTQYKTSLAELEASRAALAYQLALKQGQLTLFRKEAP